MIDSKQISNLVKQTTVNIVSGVNYATFTINDVNCKTTSLIKASLALVNDTNANCGDDMDAIQLSAGKSIAGSFTLSIQHTDPNQKIFGLFTINYTIN